MLLEQKMTFLNTLVDACMLWWVSTVAFSGSALGAVWVKRQGQKPLPAAGLVRKIGIGFFASTILFGSAAVILVAGLGWQTAILHEKLGVEGFWLYEFVGAAAGIAIGTTSCVLALFAWNEMFKAGGPQTAHAPGAGPNGD